MADGRHFKNRYIAISQQKSSDFDEILYTAEYFELDERHVINNKKSCIGQNPSSTERISCLLNKKIMSGVSLRTNCWDTLKS